MENRLLNFLSRLTGSKTFDESWEVYLAELATLGINHSLYGFILFQNKNRDLSDQFSYVTNYQQEFLDIYDSEDYATNDSSLEWCLTRNDILEWCLKENLAQLTPEQQRVDDLGRDYGIEYGYSIPVELDGGTKGGFGLSATGIGEKEFKRDIARELPYINGVAQLFHSHVQNLPKFMGSEQQHGDIGDALSDKEREVIKLLAHGYGTQEIPEKMHRSQASVNGYIHNAKKKLKALNAAQLVAKALILKLI